MAAAAYIEEHNLQKVVEDAINATIKAKPEEPKKGPRVSKKRLQEREEVQAKATAQRIERAVQKAEKYLAQATAEVGDQQQALELKLQVQAFMAQLVTPIADMKPIVLNYRQSWQQADEDLLLFALGMTREQPQAPLGPDADLLLLTHVL